MGISSSALATLVIAGTALGGTAIAVVANNSQADVSSSHVSKLVANPTADPVDPTGTTSNSPNNEVGTIENVTPAPGPTAPAPNPVITPTTPPTYGGGGKGDDNGSDDGDSNEGSDDGGKYGHHYNDDDEGSDD